MNTDTDPHTETSTFIHASNLAAALQIAIYHQRKLEEQEGYGFKSAMLAGWEDVLEAITKGYPVTIK